MDIGGGSCETTPAPKPIQQNNENIEPRVTEKVTQQTTKSFYNNKETQNPVQNSSKITSTNTNNDQTSQSGTFNNFKIFGISSLKIKYKRTFYAAFNVIFFKCSIN